MRKTLVAVAAALAFGSLSAHAGDVQMYGVIDVGFSYVHSDADQPGVDSVDKFTMENASEFGSRWGIRGTEDLGNGYKVIRARTASSLTTARSIRGRLFGVKRTSTSTARTAR
ncbi:MAG: porin [Sutterella wadsworthensis]